MKRRRAERSRSKIFGTAEKPRLSVFRSNRATSAQLIDDEKGMTIACASGRELEKKGKRTKSEEAKLVGALIAKKAKEKGVSRAVFDRGSYRYHGRVKALAEGAREGGIAL